MMPSSSAGRRSGGGPHNTDQARRNGPAIVAPRTEAISRWAGSSRPSVVETLLHSGLVAKRAEVAGQCLRERGKGADPLCGWAGANRRFALTRGPCGLQWATHLWLRRSSFAPAMFQALEFQATVHMKAMRASALV